MTDWGRIEWLVSGELNPGAELTFGYCEIFPGRENPRHVHPNCDEALYVLEGALEHELDGEVVPLAAGQALHIPRGLPHQARNPGAHPARLVVAYSTGDRRIVPVEPA